MGEIAKSDLVVFTPENLKQYTNDFSEDNFLGDTHFGKLLRGTILHGSDPSAARHVTVKIWEDPPPRDPVIKIGDIFDWPQRIRVAIGLACLLDFLHGEDGPYMVRNIDAAHILVDKDCNPSLCDFSMLRGGVLLGNRAYSADRGLSGSFGYIDEHLVSTGGMSPAN